MSEGKISSKNQSILLLFCQFLSTISLFPLSFFSKFRLIFTEKDYRKRLRDGILWFLFHDIFEHASLNY